MNNDKYLTYQKIIHYSNKNSIKNIFENTNTKGIRYCLALNNSYEYPYVAEYFDLLRCFRTVGSDIPISHIRISSGSWIKEYYIQNNRWYNFSEKLLPIHHEKLPINIESTQRLEIIGIKLKEKISNFDNIYLEDYGFRKIFEPSYNFNGNDLLIKEISIPQISNLSSELNSSSDESYDYHSGNYVFTGSY
ncbi:hypothetical protein Indivirus_2_121 [Indivirus ILV1]|uniref:Uncharacterized protein n=1 Tax=Indivirus ILV1 TaxID=1977633 RepID=A0A1V0SDF6_9VIRU|nr:hypothetical protein Indivirus_2_121 [Indivirus ILV1]